MTRAPNEPSRWNRITVHPYVTLSCAMSIDGRIDDLSDTRLLLSDLAGGGVERLMVEGGARSTPASSPTGERSVRRPVDKAPNRFIVGRGESPRERPGRLSAALGTHAAPTLSYPWSPGGFFFIAHSAHGRIGEFDVGGMEAPAAGSPSRDR